MQIVTRNFKAAFGEVSAIMLILILCIPAIVFFLPTLGHSWKLAHIAEKILLKKKEEMMG